MSIQEINRKHIMYGLIVMLILTFMCGCKNEPVFYNCTDEQFERVIARVEHCQSVYQNECLNRYTKLNCDYKAVNND